MNLAAGTRVWTWGRAADADSFTLQIGLATVTEPLTLAPAGIGPVGLACCGWKRRGRRA